VARLCLIMPRGGSKISVLQISTTAARSALAGWRRDISLASSRRRTRVDAARGELKRDTSKAAVAAVRSRKNRRQSGHRHRLLAGVQPPPGARRAPPAWLRNHAAPSGTFRAVGVRDFRKNGKGHTHTTARYGFSLNFSRLEQEQDWSRM